MTSEEQLLHDIFSNQHEREIMTLTITKYARKPFYVDAVQVTEENMEEVAKWCNGDIRVQHSHGDDIRYIKVRVATPRNEKETMAFVGYWILYAGTGYKVYRPYAFEKAFELVENIVTSHSASVFGLKPVDVDYRDAKTGKYVTEEYADENPETTVGESVPKASGDIHSPFAVIPEESLKQGADAAEAAFSSDEEE